jgi:hypothetical protein
MSSGAKPATCADEDEHGNSDPRTERSATIQEVTNKDKKKAVVKSSRKERPSSDSGHPPKTASKEASPTLRTDQPAKLERRSSTRDDRRRSTVQPPRRSSSRPPVTSRNSGKEEQNHRAKRDPPVHLAIPPIITQGLPPQNPRPYIARPVSYHAPPASATQYYPPPQYYPYTSTPTMAHTHNPFAQTSPAVPTRSLADRLNVPLPKSRPEPLYDQETYVDMGYESASEAAYRYPQIHHPRAHHIGRDEESDRIRMPPPGPKLTRRLTTSDRTTHRQPDEYGIREARPRQREQPRSTRRPSISRNSGSYELERENVRLLLERADSRATSYYGNSSRTSSQGFEDKVRDAQKYQTDIQGDAPRFTHDEVEGYTQRLPNSSRSTKSSVSRTGSDWPRSTTTRTTRSGSGGNVKEDLTITIKGEAKISVDGAMIDGRKGAEVIISRGNGGTDTIFERAMIEDRRSRGDRSSYSGHSRRSSSRSSFPRPYHSGVNPLLGTAASYF